MMKILGIAIDESASASAITATTTSSPPRSPSNRASRGNKSGSASEQGQGFAQTIGSPSRSSFNGGNGANLSPNKAALRSTLGSSSSSSSSSSMQQQLQAQARVSFPGPRVIGGIGLGLFHPAAEVTVAQQAYISHFTGLQVWYSDSVPHYNISNGMMMRRSESLFIGNKEREQQLQGY